MIDDIGAELMNLAAYMKSQSERIVLLKESMTQKRDKEELDAILHRTFALADDIRSLLRWMSIRGER